ncbi:MAG: hypothetical protein EP343_18045 [Deltaproteobacteria bacterium]|nr:MAG: hypothetical protein EP343_18045 [Deltaproteobacteria bacterium]
MDKIVTRRPQKKPDDLPGHLRCQPTKEDGPHEEIRGPRVESYAVTWWECANEESEQAEEQDGKKPE